MFRKRLTRFLIPFLTLLLMVFQSGCGEPFHDDGKLTVAVSILPQKYFVNSIAGDSIDVFVVVPPGASPATYEPSPSIMRNMNDADVWFTIGVPFETPWISRFVGANPDLRIRNTAENIELLPIGRYSVEGNEHLSEQHDHSHGSPDPHVWLSPELVRSQAEVIAEELSLLDSARTEDYSANLASFNTEIDSIQNRIHMLLDSRESKSFIVFHPSWGYFADEFGLFQVPIETAGSEPSPGEMHLLVDYARQAGISAVFVAPQFSTSSAEAIALEIGADVIYVDPLAEDWAGNLCTAAELLSGKAENNE